MKKKTKALIVAATVAAVVGVSAVSFAAWSGNSNTTATTTGKTDTISLIGFSAASVDGFTALQPYDQSATNTTIAAVAKTVALPAVSTNGTEKYDILLKADSALGLDAASKLYVKLATAAPTEEIYDEGAFTTTNLTTANGWYAVSTDNETVISDSNEASGYTAYFVLVSDASADMGKEWNFTFTAQQHTA